VGKVYDGIDERLERWIAAQPMFFVGTAPLDADGHVNVSPKAPMETLRVLDSATIAYLDFVGSGAETIAHLRENGRIVIMLCAFQGPPRIVRLHGHGGVVPAGDERFEELTARCGFAAPPIPEARRAIVVVDVERVADSCGYGVPLMAYEGRRPHMEAWAAKKLRVGGPTALLDYQRETNSLSIDGLPAVDVPAVVDTRGQAPAGDAAASSRRANAGSSRRAT
jgi:Pyridoxamine 5'-phosphate oxidase